MQAALTASREKHESLAAGLTKRTDGPFEFTTKRYGLG